jgi:hypothetical protein
MSELPTELDIPADEDFTKERLDKAFQWIVGQLRALGSVQPQWQTAVDELRQFGLARINEALLPAFQRLAALSALGFLIAQSASAIGVQIGQRLTFRITDGEQRNLFTPTQFVTITRSSTPDDWAIGKVESYDSPSGDLVVTIVASNVSPRTHDDWEITASAGTVTAAIALLANTRSARDAAIQLKADVQALKTATIQETSTIRDAAIAAKKTAVEAADAAKAAAILIQGGPVSSVNGRTGVIELTQDDVPGLVEALASRYTKAEIDNLFRSLVGGAPDTLNALNELAAALGNDPNFATTMAAALGGKVAKGGDVMSGPLTLPGNAAGNLHAIPKQQLDAAVAAINQAIASINQTLATKLSNSGHQTIAGDIIARAFRFVQDGSQDTGLYWDSDGKCYVANNGAATFVIQADGNIWLSRFGWLSDYVWGIANSARDAAQNYAWSNLVQDVRLSGYAERQSFGAMQQADWGCVVTGINHQNAYATTFAFRSLQKSVGGNWYTIGQV